MWCCPCCPSVTKAWMFPHVKLDFSVALKQFWLDESQRHKWQRDLNPGLLGKSKESIYSYAKKRNSHWPLA